MLIGNSLPEYYIIRTAILGLRLIAPASCLYCVVVPAVKPHLFFRRPFPLPISIWMVAEAGFLLFGFLPLKLWLQRPAPHPEPPVREKRQLLFQRCIKDISEPDAYLSKWFLGAPPNQIKRENLKQFYAWSIMNKEYGSIDSDESVELDGYVYELERQWSRQFEPGWGNASSLRGTIDPVPTQHRPLMWYLIISLVDSLTSAKMMYYGFQFHRPSFLSALTELPTRLVTLPSLNKSRCSTLSYWYREHTAKDRLPILFIHGIGVGMHTYADFLRELKSNVSEQQGNDQVDQVGVIAVEILSISSRICAPALAVENMRHEILQIVDGYGWQEFVLVGHSYGTAISAGMLRDPQFSKRIKATILMDPICLQLHLPDVAYNFTRRKPSSASEHMLYFFASQDAMVSHTIARRFFWSEYILWNEDIESLPLTVTLSGQDIIVPSHAVWQYLTHRAPAQPISSSLDDETSHLLHEGNAEWEQGLLKVIWFEDFNHAGLFKSKGAQRGIAQIARGYSKRYGRPQSSLENGHGNVSA